MSDQSTNKQPAKQQDDSQQDESLGVEQLPQSELETKPGGDTQEVSDIVEDDRKSS